jgi:hypothetical protein
MEKVRPYLKYSIPESKLKGMGYIFQKLYARDYKTYRKKVGHYTIWLWVKEHRLEVNDWFDSTIDVINFFKENQNDPIFEKESFLGGKRSMKILLNRDTKHIIKFESIHQEYIDAFNSFQTPDETIWEEYNKKYEDYSEIFLGKDTMEELIKEIDILVQKPQL